MRCDDIVTFSGLTCEINNTDAEGRLCLADGVARVDARRPRVQGRSASSSTWRRSRRADGSTGQRHAAVFSDDEALEARAVAAGKRSGDLCHPLPFAPEIYRAEFKSKNAELGFLKANLRPGREQALYDALIKEEHGRAKRYGGLFSQVNVATQLAFDAAAPGARVEFSSSPVHNGVAGHTADDYGRGCGGEASTAIARRLGTRPEERAELKPEKHSKGGKKKKEGGARPASETRAAGRPARRGDRLSWEKKHVDAGFTFFDDAEWVDFFAQHTADGDVAVVLTQDDALAAKLAAPAAQRVRVVHVDAALKSADLPFGQFLVAAIALLAEADVVAANSGSNMAARQVQRAALARGPATMHDFDGHWTADDAARGYAPCLLQYLVRSEGPKLDGCPGDAPAARASTREDRDYDERSAMHYAFQTVAHQEEKRDISVSKFAALVSEFIKDEFNTTVPPRYIRESYRQDMVECLLNVNEKKVTKVDQKYFAILRDDPGYERAFKEDAQAEPLQRGLDRMETRWSGRQPLLARLLKTCSTGS
ncbi:manganese ion binding protein [Aureococcus anophagefferens]|nr:manganese ion binding protein [Aureococcus anophagefferens]